MYCKNSEIFYFFLFLLIFAASHLLLMRYHLNYMSIGEKYTFSNNATLTVSEIVKIKPNKTVSSPKVNFAKIRRMSLRNGRLSNIKEPPVPSEMQDAYSVNMKFFHRQANVKLFRYSQFIV